MEFGVLGPLEVSDVGGSIQLGGPKQRTVLAHLLLRANHLVTVERLADALWGDEPPQSARNTLQTYIKRLRKLLGAERIEHVSAGYLFRADPRELDVLRFESLVKEARTLISTDLPAAAKGLRAALGLWRGPALDDLSERPSLRPEITRLEELRIAAIEERIGADLALGRHHELVPELETLIADNPYRERSWGYLMVALYRSGRQGDSLAAYQRARGVLTAELGIDPSPELQRIQEQVLSHDPVLELGGESLRGYRVLELLGEGAFGAVHRAFQPEVGREVAVKIIHPRFADDPEFIRRFDAEAQLVARLEHPHIVPVYDYWREPGGTYLVMRYLRGGNLRQLLAQGPLAPDRAVKVVDEVARALAAAHRLGVVHRDVQPANILFDEEGNTYLSDFGIARDLTTARTIRERTPGDLAYYLSPEEARGDTPTLRSDIYSLGLVMYECLTGQRAIGDLRLDEGFEKAREPIPPVSSTRPDLPVAIDEVISRATAEDPAERHPDVLGFAAAAREVFAGTAPGSEMVAEIQLRNPYKGLRAFSEIDADDFFGREELVQRLVARLAEDVEGRRFLGVVGSSGSGKSSVVRAGLVPALRAGALRGSQTWFFTEMTPGRQPFDELNAALLRIAVEPLFGLREQLWRDERGLVNAVERILPAHGSELVLVIDQFEELFTLVDDDDVRARFLRLLPGAMEDPRSRLRVVATLRADFYDRPLAYQGFGELLGSRTQTVTPLTPQELERAIAGPAEAVGVAVDPALVAESAAEFAERPGALPLLQYALTESFEHRRGRHVTIDSYRAIGGLSGALARRAEEFHEGLDAKGRACVRQLFLRLVALGEDSVETRRRVLRAELASAQMEGRPIDSVADALGALRLLSFDRDPVTRGPTVEVAHEALLWGWERLATWIDEARDDLRTNRSVEAAAAEWDGGARDQSLLLRGSRLERIEAWASRTDLALTAVTREYVDASLRERDADQQAEDARRRREASLRRRSINRLRGLVAVLVVGVLVTGSLAVVVRDRGRQAEREARIATARELAAAAVKDLTVDAERSLRLALEAVETTYRVDGTALPEVTEALHLALQENRLVLTVPGYSAAYAGDGDRLLVVGARGFQEGGTTPVRIYDVDSGEVIGSATGRGRGDAAFSSDGKLLATSDWEGDGHTYLWETATGDELGRFGRVAGLSLWFSPDGGLLAFAGSDGRTYVFDVRTGERKNALEGADPLAFSPDGKRLLMGDAYWDRSLAPVIVDPLEPHSGARTLTLVEDVQVEVRSGAWSRNGSLVATLGPASVAIWSAHSGAERFALFPPSGRFTSVTFGPRSLLATGMADGTAVVWALSANGAEPILTVGGHAAKVDTVSFNADGTRLATASDDGTVKIWNVSREGGGEWMTLPGSGAVAFSPDGRSLAAGTKGGNVFVYDAATGRMDTLVRSRTGPINAIDFDPTGSMIAIAGSDGTAWTSDVRTGVELWRVPEQPFDSPVLDVAFSPDGGTLATATFAEDHPSSLWDAVTGDRLRILPYDVDDANASHAVEFSPDGRSVAGSGFSFVRVWRLEDGSYVQIETGVVNALAFSPDGNVLASGANDGSLKLSDPRTGHELISASPNLGEVTDVAFSPDGATLATSSSDGTVRLWDGRTLEPIMMIGTMAEGRLAYSPDGSRLAHTAEDGVVRVLALGVDELIALAKARLTRSWTEDECRTYLHLNRCPSTVG